jgi:hypothetical protein
MGGGMMVDKRIGRRRPPSSIAKENSAAYGGIIEFTIGGIGCNSEFKKFDFSRRLP